jgi:hypothetical protein
MYKTIMWILPKIKSAKIMNQKARTKTIGK